MLKISESKTRNQTITLRLEGRLVGPWVGELQDICEPLVGDGSQLALDLAEVSFADESGVALLSSLKRRGAMLLNATPFVGEQLKSAAPVTTPALSGRAEAQR
jgi:ABC-type transporter Mla MlaB component